jgi:hypothetical protein
MAEVVYKWKWMCVLRPVHVYCNVEGEDVPDASREEGGYARRTCTLMQSTTYYKSRDLCAEEGLRHIPPFTTPRSDYLIVEAYPVHLVGKGYRLESERLKSFTHWPKYMLPTSKDMAKAGFYYLGQGDRVRCFTCGLVLRNWKPTDDAWNEHMTHATDCLFLTVDMRSTSIKP